MTAHTRPLVRRTPRQQLALAGAVLFGSAPLAAGFVRLAQTGDDRQVLWMAIIATLFTAGVLAAAIGERRSKHTAQRQAVVIFVAATLLTAGLGHLMGATSTIRVLTTAMVMASALAIASVLVGHARRP